MNWLLLSLSSAALSAIAAVSQKKILFKLDALEFSFLVSWFNLVLIIPFFFFIDHSMISLESLGVLFFKSILGALAFWCVMLAIKNLEISGALPLMVLTPGLVAIFAFIFIGEQLSSLEILGMLSLILGTYILESNNFSNVTEPFKIFIKSKNHHYIVFALVLFTATSILDKVLLKDFKLPPIPFIAYQQLFMSIIFLIMILFLGKKPKLIFTNISKYNFGWILLIAVLTIGYRYTQIEAIKLAPVALVLSVKRISVFFAAIVGGKIFHEHNLIRKAIATAIMIAGAVLLIKFE